MSSDFCYQANGLIRKFIEAIRVNEPEYQIDWRMETISFNYCETNARKRFRVQELSTQLKVIQAEKDKALDRGADYERLEAAYRPIFKLFTNRMALIEKSIIEPETGPLPIMIFSSDDRKN